MVFRTARGIAFAAIIICALASPAFADGEAEKPTITGPVPAHTERVFVKRLHERVYIDVRYPKFSIPFVDKDVAKNADFENWRADFKRLAVKRDAAGRVIPSERTLSYDLYSPKKGILSVVLSSWVYCDTAHGYATAEATTYDLTSRKILRMKDIFPNWKQSEKELEALMVAFLEDDAKECMANGVGFSKEYAGFYLAPDGLTAVYSGFPPPLQGPCSAVFLDKEDLERAGADMRYWQP